MSATQYLVPCACGKTTAVGPAQAGEIIRCQCGASIEVPTVRNLSQLEQTEAKPVDAAREWTTRQGLMFLGAVIVVASLAFAGYLYRGRPEKPFYDLTASQKQIDKLSPQESFDLWRDFQSNRWRQPPPVIANWNRLSAEYHRRLYMCAGVAIFGVLLAGSGLLIPATRRP